jgi:hypothetical protein
VLDDEVVEAGSKGVMLALTGAAVVALAAWGVLAQGCTVNSCVGSKIVFERAPGELIEGGRAWETSPVEGPWLAFPPQRSYELYVPFPRKVAVTEASAYVSVAEVANADQWVAASGNLAEFSQVGWDDGRNALKVIVHNDTCANYYVRLVLRTEEVSVEAVVDAGAPDATVEGDPSAPSADAGDAAD